MVHKERVVKSYIAPSTKTFKTVPCRYLIKIILSLTKYILSGKGVCGGEIASIIFKYPWTPDAEDIYGNYKDSAKGTIMANSEEELIYKLLLCWKHCPTFAVWPIVPWSTEFTSHSNKRCITIALSRAFMPIVARTTILAWCFEPSGTHWKRQNRHVFNQMYCFRNDEWSHTGFPKRPPSIWSYSFIHFLETTV